MKNAISLKAAMLEVARRNMAIAAADWELVEAGKPSRHYMFPYAEWEANHQRMQWLKAGNYDLYEVAK